MSRLKRLDIRDLDVVLDYPTPREEGTTLLVVPDFILDVIKIAARAYRELLANGQRVEWCDRHSAAQFKDFPWCAYAVSDGPTSCRIVSKLLIDPPEEESRDV